VFAGRQRDITLPTRYAAEYATALPFYGNRFMDALSNLIHLARPQASLELRCSLEGSFKVEHEPSDGANAPFHLVLSGGCLLKTENKSPISLQAGDFILLPNGERHQILSDRSNAGSTRPIILSNDGMLPLKSNGSGCPDVDLLCGSFSCPPGPARLLFRLMPDPVHVSLAASQSASELHTLVTLIRNEAESRKPGAMAIVTALSQALFTMALRTLSEDTSNKANSLALLCDPRLAPSIQALLDQPGRPWTITELGALAAMSRATYARHFVEKAGITVFEFLTEIRMTIACGRLLETQRSAGDIGMDVGYQSEAAFGRAFSQAVGMTPGRYRKHHRQQTGK
jgi:AraC family transcriptional activator of mtrCDE